MIAPLFGVLNINKPSGITSRDVVNQVQRLVKPMKCGHAGTLDPMATGVLLVCVGQATRLISVLQDTTKVYEARFLLGQRSDTDDNTGQIEYLDAPAKLPTREVLEATLRGMTGLVQQVPPAFSAVHVNGQRAYELARRGQEVKIDAKEVLIDRIEIQGWQWPRLDVRITCGSGTYVRSIARDLGHSTGCGGLMSRLARTAVGRFQIEDAIDPETLTTETIQTHLHPAASITSHLPQYICRDADRELLTCGKVVEVMGDRLTLPNAASLTTALTTKSSGRKPSVQVALCSEQHNQLWAVAELSGCGTQLQPRLVFVR